MVSDIPGVQHSAAFWAIAAEQMAIKAAETLDLVMAGGLSDEQIQEAQSVAKLYMSAVKAFSSLAVAIRNTGLKPRDGMPEIKLPTLDPRDFDNPGGPWMN